MYTNLRTKYWTFYALAALKPVIRASLSVDQEGVPSITTNTVADSASGSSSVLVDTLVPAKSNITGTGIASGTTVSSVTAIDSTYTIYLFDKATIADGAAGAELTISTSDGEEYSTTLLKASVKGDLTVYGVGAFPDSLEGKALTASIADVTDTDTTVSNASVYPETHYELNLSNDTTADVASGTVLTVPAVASTFSTPDDSNWSIQNIASTTDTTGIFTFVLTTAANFTPNAAYINSIIALITNAESDYTFTTIGVNVSGTTINIVFRFTAPEPYEVGMPLFEDKTGADTIVKAGREVTINSATFNCDGNIV